MLKAIVYESHTGHTREYVGMIAGKAGLQCLTVKEAKQKLKKEDEVIFMGWISAGQIVGLKKAQKIAAVKAVGVTGISAYSKEYADKLKAGNKVTVPFFYMPGGFAMEKLSGKPKMMMKMAHKTLVKMARQTENPTPEQKMSADMLEFGGTMVDKKYVKPMLDWVMENKK